MQKNHCWIKFCILLGVITTITVNGQATQSEVYMICPTGSIKNGTECYIQGSAINVPPIYITCTPPMKLLGFKCNYTVPAPTPTPSVTIDCASPMRLERNKCVYPVPSPSQPLVSIRCESPMFLEGDKCVYQVTTPSTPVSSTSTLSTTTLHPPTPSTTKHPTTNPPTPDFNRYCCIHNINSVYAPVSVSNQNYNHVGIYSDGKNITSFSKHPTSD